MLLDAQKALEGEGIYASVVSMPSWDRFEEQSKEYKESVIPKTVKKRLAIEMGSSLGWHRYAGDEGDVLAIDQFGASAPGEKIIEEYGFTVENVVARVKALFTKLNAANNELFTENESLMISLNKEKDDSILEMYSIRRH